MPSEESQPTGNLTMNHAAQYAHVLFMDRFVIEVWLYGSLADVPSPGFVKTGGDVDLIAIVRDAVYANHRRNIESASPENRFSITLGALGPITRFNLTLLNAVNINATQKFPLDLLLFPPDWQERAKELDEEEPRLFDPGFIQRIAPLAMIYNPETRVFESLAPAKQTAEAATGA